MEQGMEQRQSEAANAVRLVTACSAKMTTSLLRPLASEERRRARLSTNRYRTELMPDSCRVFPAGRKYGRLSKHRICRSRPAGPELGSIVVFAGKWQVGTRSALVKQGWFLAC